MSTAHEMFVFLNDQAFILNWTKLRTRKSFDLNFDTRITGIRNFME